MRKTLIHKLIDISFELTKTNPSKLVLKAFGQTFSSGWTNPELINKGISPTGDLIFDFVAVEPSSGIVLPTLTKIYVETEISDLELAQALTITVNSKTNSIIEHLRSSSLVDFNWKAIVDKEPPNFTLHVTGKVETPNGEVAEIRKQGEEGQKLILLIETIPNTHVLVQPQNLIFKQDLQQIDQYNEIKIVDSIGAIVEIISL